MSQRTLLEPKEGHGKGCVRDHSASHFRVQASTHVTGEDDPSSEEPKRRCRPCPYFTDDRHEPEKSVSRLSPHSKSVRRNDWAMSFSPGSCCRSAPLGCFAFLRFSLKLSVFDAVPLSSTCNGLFDSWLVLKGRRTLLYSNLINWMLIIGDN